MSDGALLLITYYWPPAGGPGVQRWLKTARYLKEAGQEVLVLTVDPGQATYPLRDVSLEAEAEGLEVFRTDTTDWFVAYQKLTGRKEVPFSGFANQAGKPGPLQAISRFIRGNFFLPDPRRGWNRHALHTARTLFRDRKISAVLTTSPPHSTHLMGRQLQKEFNVRWFADFRDPWTDIYYYHRFYPTPWARKVDQAMEKSVLEKADGIIAVSADLQRTLIGKSPLVSDEKFLVLPNGYDTSDFQINSGPPLEPHPFVLAYTGTLSLQYPIHSTCVALRAVLAKGHVLTLRMAGRPAKEAVDAFQKIQKEYPTQFSVEDHGYLPHKESVHLMQTADALLLLIPDIHGNEGILTGKLFEYIGTGRPVWGFGPEHGDAAALLRENRAGELFYPTEDGELQAAELLEKWITSAEIVYGAKNPQAYTRQSLTHQLIQWMQTH